MTKRVRRRHQRVRRSAVEGNLLDRMLAAPHLDRIVPLLQAEVLHRVIQHCGLEHCGPLLQLATPSQLTRLFDLDLWRSPAPGLDEQFDADRFGAWLEVLVEEGESTAASILASIESDVVAGGLAQHVRVFDYAAVAPFMTLDGDEMSPGHERGNTLRCEVGGYVVAARHREFWDAITAVLAALADAHANAFNRIMRACCRVSSSRPEVDGLDDLLPTNDQAVFDLALDREARRDAQGYVTPAQARAFLEMSRRIDLRQAAIPPRDAMTRAYFNAVDDPMVVEGDIERSGDHVDAAQDSTAEAVAAIIELLHESGAIPRAARGLLGKPHADESPLARIRAQLQWAHDRDPQVHAIRNAELAYLANVIMAGLTIQARAITADEASNAAMAVCNLGLENWPAHWLGAPRRASDAGLELPEDFLAAHDLVTVFRVGWTILYENVCMYAADTLIGTLTSFRGADDYVEAAIDDLRVTLIKHWRAGSPWQARDVLDVIAILDMPAWAALLGLIDQLPTLHAAVDAVVTGSTRQIDPSGFQFISENTDVGKARDFMQRLPALLRG
jgi:hypothetical protein